MSVVAAIARRLPQGAKERLRVLAGRSAVPAPEEPALVAPPTLEQLLPPSALAALPSALAAVEATVAHFDLEHRDYLQHHARRIAYTLALIPHDPEPGARAIDLASYAVVASYARRLGYAVEPTGHAGEGPEQLENIVVGPDGPERFQTWGFDVEIDRFPYPDDTFDVTLCGEMLEHMALDPMHLLAEINRITKPGGVLILTTPNIASTRSVAGLLQGTHPYQYVSYRRDRSLDRHHVEWTVHEVQLLLEAAGFDVEVLTTLATWDETDPALLGLLSRLGYPTTYRDDNIFAMGRKVRAEIERYPSWVYDDGPVVRYESHEEPDFRRRPVAPEPTDPGIGTYRGAIDLDDRADRHVRSGETIALVLRVTNESGVDWRGPGSTPVIWPGYRFVERDGGTVAGEGRIYEGLPLLSGCTTPIHTTIAAPSEPGRYRLEIDVVHEQVRWFDCGVALAVDVVSEP